MKKLVCLLIVFIMTLTTCIPVFASTKEDSQSELNTATICAQQYKSELLSVLQTENLRNANVKLDHIPAKNGKSALKISQHFILQRTVTATPKLTTNRMFTSGTIYGMVITVKEQLMSNSNTVLAEFTSQGDFNYDGNRVQAVDVSGSVVTYMIGWSGKTTSTTMSSGWTTSNAWTKTIFSASLYIGIAPVGMVVQTAEANIRIAMYPDGTYRVTYA